jgi:hypothetical protein
MRVYSCLSRWLLLGTVAAIPQDTGFDNETGNDAQDDYAPSYPHAPVSTYESSRSSENAYIDEIRVISRRAAETTTATRTTCSGACTVYAPRISVVSWVPEDKIIYTANVTVGIITTLIFLCNDIMVATRAQTEYHWGAAPAGMYPPYCTTNDRGNAVAIAAFTDAAITSVVELVYPNSHIAYDSHFSWQGVIDVSLYDDNPGVCATATSELSTTHLGSHGPFSRIDYLQPTATRANRSDSSGRGYQPLWVSLDSQPPESFFTHLRIVFYSLMQDIHTYGAWLGCNITASVSPTPSLFREPRYLFEHRTMSIDLDIPGTRNNNTSEGIWRNSTGSGALCVAFMQQFAGLCERPEIPSSSDECVHTITIWNDTTPTGLSFSNTEDDRYGSYSRITRFTPQSATGFETAYSTGDTAIPFLYAESDWSVDGKGGVVTTPEPPVTPAYRNPDASEAAVISAFLKSRTEELRVGLWKPQRTQPATKSVQGLELTNSEAVSKYFREPLVYHAQPSGDGAKPSDRRKAAGLNAIGSAFNRIFFQETSTNRPLSGNPIVGANRVGLQTAATTVFKENVPTSITDQAEQAAADVLADTTPTTSRGYLYIQVPTTINDIPTAVGGYILPMTSTVMAGQQITVNGQATQLSVPDLLPIFLSTTVSNVPTSTVAYIVSGHSIGKIGQTVTLNDEPTVLATPDAVFVLLPTTGINGISTTPAYIISGFWTASIGQRVNLNGTPTILTAPDVVPVYVTTMTGGVEESGLAYIITGSMTATVGQTITTEGSTTVLAEPTSQLGVVEGGTRRNRVICCNAVLVGIGAAFVVWL